MNSDHIGAAEKDGAVSLVPPLLDELIEPLRDTGYCFVRAAETSCLLDAFGFASDEWMKFQSSWNALWSDEYLARLGRNRRRRHAVFRVSRDGNAQRAPHRPHYQSPEFNPLQGGIERWFAPIEADIADSPCLKAAMAAGAAVFGRLAPRATGWDVEAHQFRIEARPGASGHPTPEGPHRDGVDFVLVILINRINISSGTTTIHSPAGELIGEFTLRTPLDAALVVDRQVLHGVTPVEALDPTLPAYRDVLVVTYKNLTA